MFYLCVLLLAATCAKGVVLPRSLQDEVAKLRASDAATRYVWSVGGFGCVF